MIEDEIKLGLSSHALHYYQIAKRLREPDKINIQDRIEAWKCEARARAYAHALRMVCDIYKRYRQ